MSYCSAMLCFALGHTDIWHNCLIQIYCEDHVASCMNETGSSPEQDSRDWEVRHTTDVVQDDLLLGCIVHHNDGGLGAHCRIAWKGERQIFRGRCVRLRKLTRSPGKIASAETKADLQIFRLLVNCNLLLAMHC